LGIEDQLLRLGSRRRVALAIASRFFRHDFLLGMGMGWLTMKVPETGITPGNRKHAVEFGLPVADQNHPNSFIILREAREKAQTSRRGR
jgi:hypothetical protein